MTNLKYKAQLRIPTEMYAYLEVSVEDTPEEIVKIYREFTELVKVQPKGLSDKDFREFLNRLHKGDLQEDPGIWYEMNPQQSFCANELKKLLKRNNK